MDYLIYLPTGGYYNDILEGGSMENRVVQEAWDTDLKRNEHSLTKRLLKYMIFPGFNTPQRQKTPPKKKTTSQFTKLFFTDQLLSKPLSRRPILS